MALIVAFVASIEMRFGQIHIRRYEPSESLSRAGQQISHRLKADFPDDESMRISHEAIYQALYVQSRGAQRELVACLRAGRALRVPRSRARKRADGMVTPEVMISQRPAEVSDRAVPGHWESSFDPGTTSGTS